MRDRLRLLVVVALFLLLANPLLVFAATTADVAVTATPTFVGITVSPTTYDFGVVALSGTPSSATTAFTITNSSSVTTNNTVSVTTTTWAGGVTWAHSDTNTAGANQAGMLANKGGTWGTGDVIVKNATPNILATTQAANTNWTFGLKLTAPTSVTDGVQKSIVVRITAAQG